MDSDEVMESWTVDRFTLYKSAAEHLLKLKGTPDG